jgi:hypothetical protein
MPSDALAEDTNVCKQCTHADITKITNLGFFQLFPEQDLHCLV